MQGSIWNRPYDPALDEGLIDAPRWQRSRIGPLSAPLTTPTTIHRQPQLPPVPAPIPLWGKPLEVRPVLTYGRAGARMAGTSPSLIDPSLASNGPAGNAARLESSFDNPAPPQAQPRSGGTVPDTIDTMAAAADALTNTLPLVQTPVAAPDAAEALMRPATARQASGASSYQGATPITGRADAFLAGERAALSSVAGPNLSGGGPGTSTAQGDATVARQAARRAGASKAAAGAGREAVDWLGVLDDFIATPGQTVGHAAEQGLLKAAGHLNGAMPRTAGLLTRLAPAARWAVPTAGFAATTALPAVMGAMDGYNQAGAGGAAIQGGSALAGGLIGQALIPLPFVGAAIGAMAGNAIGGGLTGLARGAVEKAQAGDTGFMGGIGRALDPLIDTPFEKEQQQVMQQMNSPAMQAIQQQEETRRLRAQNQQHEQVFMQAALQGLL